MSRYKTILDELNRRAPKVTPVTKTEAEWVPMPPYVVGHKPPRVGLSVAEIRRRHPSEAAPPLPAWWPAEVPLMQRFARGERAGLYIPRYVLDALNLVMSQHAPAFVRALGEIVRDGGSILRFRMMEELGGHEAALHAALATLEIENSPALYIGKPQSS